MVSKDKDILQLLKTFGLVSIEDMRINLGDITEELPDADSDLENEINKRNVKPDDITAKVKSGIEYSEKTENFIEFKLH